MMERRAFLGTLAAGLLVAPLAAQAQQAAHIPCICVIADPPHAPNLRLEAFRKGLPELGYVEGQSVPSRSASGMGSLVTIRCSPNYWQFYK